MKGATALESENIPKKTLRSFYNRNGNKEAHGKNELIVLKQQNKFIKLNKRNCIDITSI